MEDLCILCRLISKASGDEFNELTVSCPILFLRDSRLRSSCIAYASLIFLILKPNLEKSVEIDYLCTKDCSYTLVFILFVKRGETFFLVRISGLVS